MRTSVVIAIAGVLVLAAGGGYYGLQVWPQQQFRAGLDQTLATLPYHATGTYKDAHYAPLSHHAIVTGLTLHAAIAGQSPQQVDVTFDSIELANPNLDFSKLWIRAQSDKAAFAPDTKLPVADAIIIKGMTVHAATTNATEETMRIDKLRVYPWALLHEGMPSLQQLQASFAAQSKPPTLAELQPLLRAEAAVMLGLAYDSYEAGPLKSSVTLPEGRVDYSVGKTISGGFDRGVLRGGNAEAIAVSSTQAGALAIDRVVMGGADLHEPLDKLVDGAAVSPALLDGIKIGRIEYAGITAQPQGKPPIHATNMTIGPIAFVHGMPVAGAFAWQDIAILKSQLPDPRTQEALDKLGLDTLTISFAMSYDWDPDKQHASLHDTMLKVNELGTLTLSAELTNVAADVAGLTQTRLAHARLRFEDASLVDRLLRVGATQSGTDPTAYRAQIATLVRQQSMVAAQGSPALTAAGQAFGDFIASPHSLTVELSPPVPVPVLSLRAAAAVPAALATVLGLAVSANQP